MAASRYGLSTHGPASNAHTELHTVPTPSAANASAVKPWSPDSPLFAFGLIAALTFGAMAFSTSVRVGHTTAALKVGNT